jgi:hypothetical protein
MKKGKIILEDKVVFSFEEIKDIEKEFSPEKKHEYASKMFSSKWVPIKTSSGGSPKVLEEYVDSKEFDKYMCKVYDKDFYYNELRPTLSDGTDRYREFWFNEMVGEGVMRRLRPVMLKHGITKIHDKRIEPIKNELVSILDDTINTMSKTDPIYNTNG